MLTDPIVVFALALDDNFDEDSAEMGTVAPPENILATTNRDGDAKPYQVAVRYGALLRLLPLGFWASLATALKEPVLEVPELEVDYSTPVAGVDSRAGVPPPSPYGRPLRYQVNKVSFNDEDVPTMQIQMPMRGGVMDVKLEMDLGFPREPYIAIVANLPESVGSHEDDERTGKKYPVKVDLPLQVALTPEILMIDRLEREMSAEAYAG